MPQDFTMPYTKPFRTEIVNYLYLKWQCHEIFTLPPIVFTILTHLGLYVYCNWHAEIFSNMTSISRRYSNRKFKSLTLRYHWHNAGVKKLFLYNRLFKTFMLFQCSNVECSPIYFFTDFHFNSYHRAWQKVSFYLAVS